MDEVHDDVHLNLTQRDMQIDLQIKIHFIHIWNKNMYEIPIKHT
jgi:hypothetical protein